MHCEVTSVLPPELQILPLEEALGQDVELAGQVFKVRELSGFGFIYLHYGPYTVQCVYTGELAQQHLSPGACIQVTGKVVAASLKDPFLHPRDREVQVTKLEVLSRPAGAMPFDITKKKLDIHNDVLFDHRPISLRHPTQRAIFRVQSALAQGIRDFLVSQHFCEIHSPKIVQEGAEGGANIYSLDYFGQTAYLTQSPQFYKEFGSGVFGRVFEIGPVFRAERHRTSRHLNEYTSVDFELGPIRHLSDVMAMLAALLRAATDHVNRVSARELDLLGVSLPRVLDHIPVLTFRQVKEQVQAEFGISPKESDDLAPIEEAKICEAVEKKTGSAFLFVTEYPASKRPFYTMNSPEDPSVTRSFDLLLRGTEISTGGQRIHCKEDIDRKLRERGMNPEDFSFFTSAHHLGLPPHGGMGMGLERLTQKLLGLDSVKLASLFPRDTTRLSP